MRIIVWLSLITFVSLFVILLPYLVEACYLAGPSTYYSSCTSGIECPSGSASECASGAKTAYDWAGLTTGCQLGCAAGQLYSAYCDYIDYTFTCSCSTKEAKWTPAPCSKGQTCKKRSGLDCNADVYEGVWDEDDGRCVYSCSGGKENTYVDCSQSAPKTGDGKCEDVCGADPSCDEKSPGSTCKECGVCSSTCNCNSDSSKCPARDTDGGINYFEKGTCTWRVCSSGYCTDSSSQTDSCSGDILYELYPDPDDGVTDNGPNYCDGVSKNCNDFDSAWTDTGNTRTDPNNPCVVQKEQSRKNYYCSDGRCTYTTEYRWVFYGNKPYGTDCGLCMICDGNGNCNAVPDDDSGCGVIDCDGLDTTCRDYHDLTSNRCEGLGNCKDPNTADCTSYTNAPSTTVCGSSSCPSDSCSGSCPGCVWRDYPSSCTRYCDGNGNCGSCSCGYTSRNPDSDPSYCTGCGQTWLAGKCCGDDAGEDYTNPGTGNSACVNDDVVAHNNVDSTQRYLVYNGLIYYCVETGGSGSSFININPGSSVGSWKCEQDGIWRGGTGATAIIPIRGGRIKIV